MSGEKKIDWKNMIIIALAVCLFLALLYISITKYEEKKLSQAYASGYNTGLVNTLTELYSRTENCQIATINLGENVSRSVIQLECAQSAIQELQQQYAGLQAAPNNPK